MVCQAFTSSKTLNGKGDMTRHCAECGARLSQGDVFCPECGMPTEEAGAKSEPVKKTMGRKPMPPSRETPASETRAKVAQTTVTQVRVTPETVQTGGGQRYLELLRRIGTTLLLIVALVSIGASGLVVSLLWFATAIAFYILLPRRKPPDGANFYERMPAVYGPDFIGLMLTSVFIGLPLLAGTIEARGLAGLFTEIHPSAVLSWPLSLGGIAILYIANGYAQFWLKIEGDGLLIHSAKGQCFVRYGDIENVAPYRRGLPGWMHKLAPILALFGKYNAAGAIMVSRDETGMLIRLRDGTTHKIAQDAFEKPFRKVLKAFRQHGVRLDPVFFEGSR